MARSHKNVRESAHLSRDRIVENAIAVADAEGLESVTIRRLAQEHQVTGMALYRHFQDKEGLLNAIAEKLLADVALPEINSLPWYQQMTEVLSQFLSALRPHPDLAELVLTRILLSEPGLTLAERVLLLLVNAGFPTELAAEIASYALSSLVALVTTKPGASAKNPDPELRDAAIRQKKASLTSLSPVRYPNLIAAADALSSCTNEDSYYALGVDLVVAGIRNTKYFKKP